MTVCRETCSRSPVVPVLLFVVSWVHFFFLNSLSLSLSLWDSLSLWNSLQLSSCFLIIRSGVFPSVDWVEERQPDGSFVAVVASGDGGDMGVEDAAKDEDVYKDEDCADEGTGGDEGEATYYVAEFDFVGEAEDELSFYEGERFSAAANAEDEGWLWCTKEDGSGEYGKVCVCLVLLRKCFIVCFCVCVCVCVVVVYICASVCFCVCGMVFFVLFCFLSTNDCVCVVCVNECMCMCVCVVRAFAGPLSYLLVRRSRVVS
jgi:hypothetical protein